MPKGGLIGTKAHSFMTQFTMKKPSHEMSWSKKHAFQMWLAIYVLWAGFALAETK